ncbi:MAG: SDR family oxidoreductase [Acidobacteria bacterium]|nr:MAG: SDR family oxidoreductase [Acidobacteriota bacterium]
MKANPFELKERLALITGGGRGLGFAIAQAFVEAGSRVVISGRREEMLREACYCLGPQAAFLRNDITQLDALPAFVREIETTFGAIDILVNNSGVHLKKEVTQVSDEEFHKVIHVNQEAVFSLTREVARVMLGRARGSIIMISSMASRYGIPKVVPYTASKSAVEGMTRALAVELSPRGIRVNCIAPGFIETPMSTKALEHDPERKRRVLERTPLGRLGKPEEVGHAAVFLASEAASFITGAILTVDGGNSIGF